MTLIFQESLKEAIEYSVRIVSFLVFTISICGALLGSAKAENICFPPPDPNGPYGLRNQPPDFANQNAVSPGNPDINLPAGFGQQIDDPRWSGSWGYDFSSGGASEAEFRAMMDQQYLYLTFRVYVDSGGFEPAGDGVFLGFSGDGTTAQVVKVTMNGTAPLNYRNNSDNMVSTSWWSTADGGANWTKGVGPQTWLRNTPNSQPMRGWAGEGTTAYAAPSNAESPTDPWDPTGFAWAINLRISLQEIGTALQTGPLTTGFRFFATIRVNMDGYPVYYSWPASNTSFIIDPNTQNPTNLSVANWGTVSTSCEGVSISSYDIGTEVNNNLSTTVHFGPGSPDNTFLARLTGADGQLGNIQARFRLANWGSQIGVGGDWHDIIPWNNDRPGTAINTQQANRITWTCSNPISSSNPPDFPSGSNHCPQLAVGQPTDQCILVELSKIDNGNPVTFLRSSAARNMNFVSASTFERAAEISVKGLTPLSGSSGHRDVYIYVRTYNMPEKVTERPPIDPRPQIAWTTAKGERSKSYPIAAVGLNSYQTVYNRLLLSYPTYEVHVYHDTGRQSYNGKKMAPVLEPQIPFGYFVEHKGDLTGWRHSFEGEGVQLEELAPNWYRVKVPDNGSVKVKTQIIACEHYLFGIIRCCCDVIGANTHSPAAIVGFVLLALLVVMRGVGRRRRRTSSR